MSCDCTLPFLVWVQGTFVLESPATSIWSAPIVAVLVLTSKPSRIPMSFIFWNTYLIQLSGLLMRGSPVAPIFLLLGSEKDLRLIPKQSSRESCVFTFRFCCTRSFFFLGLVDIVDLHCCRLICLVRARCGGMKDIHIHGY